MRSLSPRVPSGDRGDIIVVFLITLVPVLIAVGLVVDLGSAYLAHANLANAVDAGALAAVRATGQQNMQSVAVNVANSNYTQAGSIDYTFTTTEQGDNGLRVELRGDYEAPAYFSRLFGNAAFEISVVGAAIRYPVDLSLVIDTTESLEPGGVWTQLKDETKEFLEYFNENTDRVGIVSFSTIAQEEMQIRQDFIIPGQQAINGLGTLIDTNMERGMEQAKLQFDNLAERPEARKFVLLVTDGRPNAFRDNINVPDTPPDFYDGVVAAKSDAFGYRGLFVPADGKKIKKFRSNGEPATATNSSTAASPVPEELPGGIPVSDSQIRNLATQRTEAWADQIRADDITIYVVAILPPTPPFPLDTPDLEMLRRVANENGMSDPGQPEGEVLWSGPENLEAMLSEVASRFLVTRLAQQQ